MKKIVLPLVVGMLVWPAMAGTIPTPHVAGGWQGWQAGTDPMTETAPLSDIWTLTVPALTPGSRDEYKITDGTWTNTLPLTGNSWLFADGAGNVTITYDGNTYADGWSPNIDRLGLSTDPGAWNAAGDFLDELGGTDWTNNDPFGVMAAQGGGIYHLQVVLPPGSYNWKGVVSGSWDSISWDGRGVNTSNWAFNTDAVLDTVDFWVNAFDGTAKMDVTPEPGTLTLLALGGMVLLRRRR
ncbi:MAG: pullulanase X25 domain-containing protein [Planctomycetota bacterium]|jgi:hypothetical protein